MTEALREPDSHRDNPLFKKGGCYDHFYRPPFIFPYIRFKPLSHLLGISNSFRKPDCLDILQKLLRQRKYNFNCRPAFDVI
jgi:hypothetical protein